MSYNLLLVESNYDHVIITLNTLNSLGITVHHAANVSAQLPDIPDLDLVILGTHLGKQYGPSHCTRIQTQLDVPVVGTSSSLVDRRHWRDVKADGYLHKSDLLDPFHPHSHDRIFASLADAVLRYHAGYKTQ